MRTRGIATLFPALALAFLLAGGCSGGPGRDGASGIVTVRAVMPQDPTSLSLIGRTDRWSDIIAVQVTDSLLQFDTDLRLQPRLAESWEFSDDRRTLTFRLREGVRFHDGAPVTAHDVVFSVEQVRDPAVDARSLAPQFRDLESIEAVDALTVRARYSKTTPDVLEAWRMPVLPRHLAESGAELLTGAFARHPVGCGPFRFVRHRQGVEVVLEANDDYWDGRPAIDRLVFKIYPDQRTGYQALVKGDADLMVVAPSLWNPADAARRGYPLERLVYYRLSVWTVVWNQDGSNPFFDDPRVRRAMLLALDREKFIDKVMQGLARPGITSFQPGWLWTDPDSAPLPYDPAEARRLLEAAGWVDRDGDGIRDRDGRAFEFTLMIPASTQRLNDNMAAWKQQSWAELGLRTRIERLDWAYFREKRNAHEFDAAAWTFFFTPNPDHFELYHSSAYGEGFNFGGFSDPECDRLLERSREVFDEDERRELLFRLQRRIQELAPMAFVFHIATPALHDVRLQGIEPSAIDHWRTTRGPRVWRWVTDAEGG